MTPKAWSKVLADMFEAYVAAVALSSRDGLDTVERWLTTLWEPKISKESVAAVDTNAKQDLAKKIGGKGVKVEYLEERKPEEIKREGKRRPLRL